MNLRSLNDFVLKTSQSLVCFGLVWVVLNVILISVSFYSRK